MGQSQLVNGLGQGGNKVKEVRFSEPFFPPVFSTFFLSSVRKKEEEGDKNNEGIRIIV